MDPIDLIRSDLVEEKWGAFFKGRSEGILEFEDYDCLLRRHRLFIVFGAYSQFDFPCLPSASYAFYAVNERHATRLTREHKEIETVLMEEWLGLSEADPMTLASFVLSFYDEGIKATHHVVRDSDDLYAFAADGGYQLSREEFLMIKSSIGQTASERLPDVLSIRAVTLCGWMHCKQDLGIESIKISSDGKVKLGKREVLSRKIFSKVPERLY